MERCIQSDNALALQPPSAASRPRAQALSCIYYIASLRNVLLTFFTVFFKTWKIILDLDLDPVHSYSSVTKSQGFLYLRNFQNLDFNQTSFLIKHYIFYQKFP